MSAETQERKIKDAIVTIVQRVRESNGPVSISSLRGLDRMAGMLPQVLTFIGKTESIYPQGINYPHVIKCLLHKAKRIGRTEGQFSCRHCPLLNRSDECIAGNVVQFGGVEQVRQSEVQFVRPFKYGPALRRPPAR